MVLAVRLALEADTVVLAATTMAAKDIATTIMAIMVAKVETMVATWLAGTVMARVVFPNIMMVAVVACLED